jgi:hypothetical protein
MSTVKTTDPVVTKILQSARMWTIVVCILAAMFFTVAGLPPPLVLMLVASVWFSWHQFQMFIQFSVGFGVRNRLDELVRERVPKEDSEKIQPVPPQCRWILAFPFPEAVFSYVLSQFYGAAAVLVFSVVLPLILADAGPLPTICFLFAIASACSSALLLAFWFSSNASFHFWKIPRWLYDQMTQNFRILAATDREEIWDALVKEELTR